LDIAIEGSLNLTKKKQVSEIAVNIIISQFLILFENFSTHSLCYKLIKGIWLLKSTRFPSGDLPTAGDEPTTPDNGPLSKQSICAP